MDFGDTYGSNPAAGGQVVEEAVSQLKQDLDRRTAVYIRKEREYRSRIELLERELAKARAQQPGGQDLDGHRAKLRQLHGNIMGSIERVQEQTARIVQEQERDLLRAFRARLFDLQSELERAKARADSGAEEYVEQLKRLHKELEWTKDMAGRLDRRNQALERENAELRRQFRTQEDDREFLVKQLVAAKKDNTRLREDLASAQTAIEATDRAGRSRANMASLAGAASAGRSRGGGVTDALSPSPGASPPTPSRGGGGFGATGVTVPAGASEDRYKDLLRRMKKLLEAERRSLKQCRAQLASEMQRRTEAERVFGACVREVQVVVTQRKQRLLAHGRQEAEELRQLEAAAAEEEAEAVHPPGQGPAAAALAEKRRQVAASGAVARGRGTWTAALAPGTRPGDGSADERKTGGEAAAEEVAALHAVSDERLEELEPASLDDLTPSDRREAVSRLLQHEELLKELRAFVFADDAERQRRREALSHNARESLSSVLSAVRRKISTGDGTRGGEGSAEAGATAGSALSGLLRASKRGPGGAATGSRLAGSTGGSNLSGVLRKSKLGAAGKAAMR